MTDDAMDIDSPAAAAAPFPKPVNAMAALMAGAKGKGKASENGADTVVLSEEELKALNAKDGLPWYVRSLPYRLFSCFTQLRYAHEAS